MNLNNIGQQAIEQFRKLQNRTEQIIYRFMLAHKSEHNTKNKRYPFCMWHKPQSIEYHIIAHITIHSLCHVPSGYQQNKLVAFAGSMSCLAQCSTEQNITKQDNTRQNISCCLQVLPEHLKFSFETRHKPQYNTRQDRTVQDSTKQNKTLQYLCRISSESLDQNKKGENKL